jgi:hypothetical protein
MLGGIEKSEVTPPAGIFHSFTCAERQSGLRKVVVIRERYIWGSNEKGVHAP